MDDFIDQFFSPSAWTDDRAPETSPWVCNGPDQTNGLLPDTKEVYTGNEMNLTPPSHIVDSLITNDPSMFVCVDSSFDIEKNSLPGEPESIKGGTDSLQDIVGNLNPGFRDRHIKTPPTLLPDDTGPAESPSVQPESGSVGSNDSELSEIQPTLRELQSLTSLPQAWSASSYGGDSSLPPIVVHDTQSFGLKGQYVETDSPLLWNNNLKDNTAMQGNLPAFLSINGQQELTDHYISSAAGYKFPLGRTAEIHPSYQLNEGNPVNHYTEQSPVSQLPHGPATDVGGCNGAAKPRVRARRGQATDPHSIAERLRREKIAERMKNLQELVPNSSKTDKASMLDEIIEYVKFLQLQVKVLSMSRLGAAGAVVPLITDNQAEGSTGVLMSPSAGYGVDPFESPNDIAFEQEVMKLMESNMTAAIQFLHKKGLCLMPIALAAAISSNKASSGSISPEGKKPILTNGLVHHSNGEPNTGKSQISSKGDIRSKENTIKVLGIKGTPTDGCNGSNTKQEEVMNIANSTREMNSKVP